MSELERAIWLLMSTDDYKVVARGETWADLIYVHNSPPHPVTRIEIRLPGVVSRLSSTTDDDDVWCGSCGSNDIKKGARS